MYDFFDHSNLAYRTVDPKPENDRISGIEPIRIFYCHHGRNAWHSTWVKKYVHFCMSLTFDKAKARAEELRKQGSVFYIRELPALLLRGQEYWLAVTQINCDTPLQGYCPRLGEGNPSADRLARRLTFGVSFEDAAASFKSGSPYWQVAPPRDNSVVVVFYPSDPRLAPNPLPLGGAKLKAWKSCSSGPDYQLGWNEDKNPLSTRAIAELGRTVGFSQNLSTRAITAN
jgi:hypothetical protein